MSEIAVFVAQNIAPIIGLMAAEKFVLRDKVPQIYKTSSVLSVLPRGYGAVIIVNLMLSGFLLIYLGTKVGAARSTYKEKALKEGDKDAEDRFSYPKMYAEGFSKEAKLFNCVQRGHQNALETYTQFVVLSVVGGLQYPVTTAVAGLFWIVARIKWAEGYKTGDPNNRYQNWLSHGIWTSIIMVMSAAGGTAWEIMM
jgi:glutathione S-transferase